MHKSLLYLAIGPIFLSSLAGHAIADPAVTIAIADPHDAEIAAATENARAALRLQILAWPITPSLTVEELLEHSGKARPLDNVVEQAAQVGGIRWLDDQTCQVRLEASGHDVAAALLRIADDKSTHVPRSAGEFRRALRQWNALNFTADGTSMAPGLAGRLVPAAVGGPWALVSDRDRQAALIAARDNAVDRIVQSIGVVALPRGHRLAEALADQSVSEAVMGWLQSRPITAVEFGDDLQVRLTISAPAAELWAVLRPALGEQGSAPVPAGVSGWEALRSAVAARSFGPGVGHCIAVARVLAPPIVILPVQAPAWAGTTAISEGAAPADRSKLRTARMAERDALDGLRAQIDALSLSGPLTLGQAAATDAHIAKAIDRAMNLAQTYEVDYDSPGPGAVRAKVQLPLALLWREISK